MKKRKKKKIPPIFIILLIIIIGIFVIRKINHKSDKPNNQVEVTAKQDVEINMTDETQTSINLEKDYLFGNFEYTDIIFERKEGITTISCIVRNLSGTSTEEKKVEINLLDKAGNVKYTLNGLINPIGVGGSTKFKASIPTRITGITDISIKEKE